MTVSPARLSSGVLPVVYLHRALIRHQSLYQGIPHRCESLKATLQGTLRRCTMKSHHLVWLSLSLIHCTKLRRIASVLDILGLKLSGEKRSCRARGKLGHVNFYDKPTTSCSHSNNDSNNSINPHTNSGSEPFRQRMPTQQPCRAMRGFAVFSQAKLGTQASPSSRPSVPRWPLSFVPALACHSDALASESQFTAASNGCTSDASVTGTTSLSRSCCSSDLGIHQASHNITADLTCHKLATMLPVLSSASILPFLP